jgi:putative copper export protein
VTDLTTADVGAALARSLAYTGLAACVGAALAPLLAGSEATLRRARLVALVGALALVLSAGTRLWWPAAAIAAPDPVSRPVLELAALQTRWGVRWQLQSAACGILLLAALLPGMGRRVSVLRLTAAAGVAGALPLTGHAMSHGDGVVYAVAGQAIHAFAAAAWFGTLATLALHARSAGLAMTAPAWPRFSWLARGAAALVLVTGIARVLDNVDSLGQVWSTPWGQALMVKVAVVGAAAAAGLANWRWWLPEAMSHGRLTSPLRRTMALELWLALGVFALTGWLSGLPR